MKFPIKYLLLCFIIVFQNKNWAQFIVAGQHISSDYYHDFNPDTIINCTSNLAPQCLITQESLDINGDQINDFIIEAKNSGGQLGFSQNYIKLIPINSNQILIGQTDICVGVEQCLGTSWNFDMVKNCLVNDTINGSSNWSNSFLYVYSQFISMHCSPGCIYSVVPQNDSLIVGVRIIEQTDTLYGWIKLKDVLAWTYSAKVTIEDYACNAKAVGVSEFYNDNSFQIAPNPCTEKISITSLISNNTSKLLLYDLTGKKLMEEELIGKETQIDISSLSSGVYFIKMINDNNVLVRKIIKQ